MSIASRYLEDVIARLRSTQALGERAMAQLDDAQMHWRSDPEANSVVVLVKHLAGNMRSRWTGFLTTDGEKPDRHRDGEFIDDFVSREQVMETWEQGWACCLSAVRALGDDDLERGVRIRGQEFTVLEAINRQLSHYAYHVGQIVQLARQQVGPRDWESLSIPRA